MNGLTRTLEPEVIKMGIPWLSIITWIVSYFLSSKSGASKGKSALIATGAAIGAYYLADPSNPDNVLGLKLGDSKTVPGDTSQSSPDGGTKPVTLPTLGSSVVSEVGSTLRSWGPLGTSAVVGTTTAALTGDNKWLWLAGGALLLIASRNRRDS